MMVFWLPSILGRKNVLSICTSYYSSTSFSSTRLPCLLPLCNTGAGLCRLAFPVASWLALRLDNRSVGGVRSAGWERKKGLFSPLPLSVFQSSSKQAPQWRHRAAGCPQPPALGTFGPHEHQLSPCCRQHASWTQGPPSGV